MIAIRSMSRLRAAATHLAVSAAIAATTLTLMLALWYPPDLFSAMGGRELAALIIGIDVVIGPLITLIIFDTRKKELLFDLAVVAALQLAALSYGVYAMHAGRPVFIVATDSGIIVVTATEIEPSDLEKATREEYRHLSLTGPLLVAAEPPTDQDELSSIAFAAFGGGGIQNFPKYYVPYSSARKQTLAASRAVAELALSDIDRERLDRYLKDSGHKEETLRCLPVKTKHGLRTAILDPKGELLKVLDIRPNLHTTQ